MTPRDLLIAARKRIERPECWKQGYGMVSGKDCAWQAIRREAERGDSLRVAELDAAASRHLIVAVTGVDPGEYLRADQIFAWNDDPARTHAEVLAAFDRAIELATPPPETP